MDNPSALFRSNSGVGILRILAAIESTLVKRIETQAGSLRHFMNPKNLICTSGANARRIILKISGHEALVGLGRVVGQELSHVPTT